MRSEAALIHDDAAIPPEYRDQAEHVRAHLVHLRGGAPFLSPADALCLVTWLDDGVKVPAILAALDRCLVSRRRSKARRPLTLTAARRHLGKPPLVDPGFAREDDQNPIEPVQAALSALDDPEAHDLAGSLAALPESAPDVWVTEAVALCRTHQERRWENLAQADRDARLAEAAEQLGDIANLVDGDTLRLLAEEVARETLRKSWPRLDTATFEELAR